MKPEMTKDQRRALMPTTSAWVDACREAFGEPAGIKAREGGIVVDWRKG